MDSTTILKTNKETENLHSTIDHLNLTDIYTTLHLTIAGYIFLVDAYVMFCRRDHIQGHKTGINKS